MTDRLDLGEVGQGRAFTDPVSALAAREGSYRDRVLDSPTTARLTRGQPRARADKPRPWVELYRLTGSETPPWPFPR